MAIKIGSSAVDVVMLGASTVDAIYLGSAQMSEAGGGGGGGYQAKAATFVGGGGPPDYLPGAYIQVVPAASSPLLTMSMWVNNTAASLSAGENIIGGTDGFKLVPFFNFTTDLGGRLSDFSNTLSFGTADGVMIADTWQHVFFSCDTNHGIGLKVLNLLVDGVDVLDPDVLSDCPAFVPAISSEDGGSIMLPDIGGGPQNQSWSDVQIWIGQCIDPSAENLAKFISGGLPVDPAVAAAAFGQQSILWSGDAASFIVNQGTAGSSVTSGTITDATTSPSD